MQSGQLPKDCTREHWFKAGYCDLPNLVLRTRCHIWSWLLNPFFSRYKVHNRFSPNCSCNCKLQINCKSSSLSSGSSHKCLSFEITTVSYFPIHINAPFFLGTHSNPDVYYKYVCVCWWREWFIQCLTGSSIPCLSPNYTLLINELLLSLELEIARFWSSLSFIDLLDKLIPSQTVIKMGDPHYLSMTHSLKLVDHHPVGENVHQMSSKK